MISLGNALRILAAAQPDLAAHIGLSRLSGQRFLQPEALGACDQRQDDNSTSRYR
jgi:hypothetical protein